MEVTDHHSTVHSPHTQKRKGTVDPYKSYNDQIDAYEIFKMVIGTLILMPLRLSVAVTIFIFSGIVAKIGAIGVPYPSSNAEPLPKWRHIPLMIACFCIKVILGIIGFYRIKKVGEPDERAPIMVCNHVSIWDGAILFGHLDRPFVVVIKQEAMRLVIIHTYMKLLQAVLVDRWSHDSKKLTLLEINRRAKLGTFPPIALFPEGTTSNSNALLPFHIGAFVAGVPVQPIVLKYPWKHFCHGWRDRSMWYMLWRTLCQFANYAEMHYLPVYFPTDEEKVNPELYAANVRAYMANMTNMPICDDIPPECLQRDKAATAKKEE